jgi:hypothetical protein
MRFARMRSKPHIERYRIERHYETECDYCGYPLYVGDTALYVETVDAVACSMDCAKGLAT